MKKVCIESYFGPNNHLIDLLSLFEYGELNQNQVFHAGTKLIDNTLVTSGGRVLNVVGFGENLESAIGEAYELANQIKFEGKFFRTDIGKKGLSYKRGENI